MPFCCSLSHESPLTAQSPSTAFCICVALQALEIDEPKSSHLEQLVLAVEATRIGLLGRNIFACAHCRSLVIVYHRVR